MRETKSRTRTRAVFEDGEWVVQDIEQDYGEDLLVRIFSNGEFTGLSFYVQVKSVGSLRRHLSADERTISYAFDVKKLRQWATNTLPVLLVLWDAETDGFWWTRMDRDVCRDFDSTTAKTRAVHFDARNLLDQRALPAIAWLVQEESRQAVRLGVTADLLAERLVATRGGLPAEYDPRGTLIETESDGGASIHLFGETAQVIDALARATDVSFEQAFYETVAWRMERDGHPEAAQLLRTEAGLPPAGYSAGFAGSE